LVSGSEEKHELPKIRGLARLSGFEGYVERKSL